MNFKLNFFRSSHFLSKESNRLFSEYHFKDVAFSLHLHFCPGFGPVMIQLLQHPSFWHLQIQYSFTHLDSVLASNLISCPITLPILYIPPLTLRLSMSLSSNRTKSTPCQIQLSSHSCEYYRLNLVIHLCTSKPFLGLPLGIIVAQCCCVPQVKILAL